MKEEILSFDNIEEMSFSEEEFDDYNEFDDEGEELDYDEEEY